MLTQYNPEDAGAAIRDYFDQLSPADAEKALSAVLGQEVTLDELSTLRAQSGHGPAHASPQDHRTEDPAE